MDLRAIYYAFVTRRKDTCIHKAHPLLKIIGSIIILTNIALSNIQWLIIILLILLIEAKLGRVLMNLAWTIRGAWSLLLMLSITSYILYSADYTVTLIFRVITASFAISIFISTTTPSDLSQSLEKIGIPAKLCAIPELSIRLIPYIANDAQESLEGMMLRGEVKPGFLLPRGITKALATIIHSAIKRSESLTEALVAKFFGYSNKRTYIDELKVNKYSVTQLFIKTLMLILTLIFPDPIAYLEKLLDISITLALK